MSSLKELASDFAGALRSTNSQTTAESDVSVTRKGGQPAQSVKRIVLGRLNNHWKIENLERSSGDSYRCEFDSQSITFRFAVTASRNAKPWFNTTVSEIRDFCDNKTVLVVIWNPSGSETWCKQLTAFCVPIDDARRNLDKNTNVLNSQIQATIRKLEREADGAPDLLDQLAEILEELPNCVSDQLQTLRDRLAAKFTTYLEHIPESASDPESTRYLTRKLRENLFRILMHILPADDSRSDFSLTHQSTSSLLQAIPNTFVANIELGEWESNYLELAYDEFAESVEEDVESKDPPEEIWHPYDPAKTKIDTRPLTVDLLTRRIRESEIDLEPSFQRKADLWSKKQKSQLIESLLIRLPLPSFYFDATDDSSWLVVDGLQRLSAFRDFVVGDMRLIGLEYLTHYNGQTFNDLPRALRRTIEETQVTVHLIQPGTPAEVKFNIFRRVNTGGLVLSAQEIRHALNQGPVVKFLRELASSTEFLEATGRSIPTARMADTEFALRFLAFDHVPYSEYLVADMDAFLSKQMNALNNMKSTYPAMAKRFKASMQTAKEIFEKHAFRKLYDYEQTRYPINKALFESWSVALGQLSRVERKRLVSQSSEVLNRAIELNTNDLFSRSISEATAAVPRVHYRFKAVGDLVRSILKGQADD